MLVLAAAGTCALRLTLPVTLVIAVHPDGGGAYAVGKKDLGAPVSLLAAASLAVDYVLTVAASLAVLLAAVRHARDMPYRPGPD